MPGRCGIFEHRLCRHANVTVAEKQNPFWFSVFSQNSARELVVDITHHKMRQHKLGD
jgi:hypothetical protein